jgi:hypothetical protein
MPEIDRELDPAFRARLGQIGMEREGCSFAAEVVDGGWRP